MKRLGWRELVTGQSTTGSILVVDDDPQIRAGLSRLLTLWGYQVKEAASAEEADRWLDSQRFDVCLLDLGLPRMSGLEFLTWVQIRDPEMAVVVLTGFNDSELAMQCIDAGARTFLVKPPDPEFVRRAVKDAVAVRGLLVGFNDRESEKRLG